MAEINAMDLFREEMGNEEIFIKVNAVHRLTAIAKIIGPENTRSQLLPFIEKLIPIESDEVLFALAQEISNLRLHTPGSVIILLSPLESLSSCDETVVREQAVSSLVKLTEFMNENEITNHFAPLVLRLSQGETFSSRVSACNLFVSAYKKSGGQRDKLRQKFIELCHEETPMVRRATAAQIGDFGCVVEKEALVNELIPVYRNLASDEQDAVRMNIINSLIPLVKNFSKEDNLRHALPVALQAGEDKSWRVRLQIAKRFPELAEAFGKEIVDANLIQTFTLLLKDGEPEVRKEAVISLSRSLNLISHDKLLNLVLPSVALLVNESQTTSVKSNVATTIAEFVCFLGKEATFQRLSQPIQNLLEDKDPDVKLNMLKGLNKVIDQVGLEIINNSILQILQKNSTSENQKNWRVREEIISIAATVGTRYVNFYCRAYKSLMDYDRISIFSIQTIKSGEYAVLLLTFLGDQSFLQKQIGLRKPSYKRFKSYLARKYHISSARPSYFLSQKYVRFYLQNNSLKLFCLQQQEHQKILCQMYVKQLVKFCMRYRFLHNIEKKQVLQQGKYCKI